MFLRTASTHHTACASNASRWSTERCSDNNPSVPGSHEGSISDAAGPGHGLAAITTSFLLSQQPQWQELEHKARGGARSSRSYISSSTSSNTDRASSTLQMRSPLPLCLSQRHLAPNFSVPRPQQSPCQSNCGQTRGRRLRLMAATWTPTWAMSSAMSWKEYRSAAWRVPREWRWACYRERPRAAWLDGPNPDLSSARTPKKTQRVGWSVDITSWGSIKKWLPEACNADSIG